MPDTKLEQVRGQCLEGFSEGAGLSWKTGALNRSIR